MLIYAIEVNVFYLKHVHIIIIIIIIIVIFIIIIIIIIIVIIIMPQLCTPLVFWQPS